MEVCMRDHTRRGLAHVAGRLLSGKSVSHVYDYSRGRYFNIGGKVSSDEVRVYDYERGAHLEGRRNGNHFGLYDYGDSVFIELTMKADRFRGYDYQTGSFFDGQVRGNDISLYDYQTAQFYEYSL